MNLYEFITYNPLMIRAMRFLLCTLLLPLVITSSFVQPLSAQSQIGTFNSRSTGVDGPLNLTTPGAYVFDPKAFGTPLDQDGDHVFHFTTINIAAGVTVTLRSPYLLGPVYWLATGEVKIDGVIDLNGQSGTGGSLARERYPTAPGAGGYPGNHNSLVVSHLCPGTWGFGPGGGFGGYFGGPGQWKGNQYLVPLIGGSGGGGAGCGMFGGGAGGGGILIASSKSVTINGLISAEGGLTYYSDGENHDWSGSGGSVHILAPVIDGIGVIDVADSSGHNGVIRLERFQENFSGQVLPWAYHTTPFAVALPEHPPSVVRVVKVDNAAVPTLPKNDFTTPDATISTSGISTITIEARYIPVGGLVTLDIVSEDGPDQILTSTPLVGTFAQSTAIVTATIPAGYSRMFVYTKWNQ